MTSLAVLLNAPVAILLAPLACAALLLFGGRFLRPVADWLSVAVMGACFALSVWVWLVVSGRPDAAAFSIAQTWCTWLELGGWGLGLGMHLDPLGAMMLMIVCGLATLVLLFSTWYLHGDRFYLGFFRSFTFFCFAMIGVVLSDNLLQTFMFWELVGLGSYLLIGYWWDKPRADQDAAYQAMKAPGARGVLEHRLSPAHAQLKGFIVNRVGDFGFIAGIAITAWVVLAWLHKHPDAGLSANLLSWRTVFAAVDGGAFREVTFAGLSGGTLLTFAGLGIFLGAVGKSAQFPLHVWLPDAMQGPTTASSIIHAATMVAAGVFLVARAYPMLTPQALDVVQWTGAITCLLAASMACVQWDLKAVLAYSTISQLGYMLVGLGSGAAAGGYHAGVAHLFTHALFKCMLFLCAAAVIHACHHQQDLGRLGGLARRMPITALCALVGVLAICGLPGFSGFYSKDAILAAAWAKAQIQGGGAWWTLGFAALTATLTSYYMLRLWLRIFAGAPRDHHLAEHAHDPWPRGSFVLLLLAVFCLQAPWTGSLNPFAGHGWPGELMLPAAAGLHAGAEGGLVLPEAGLAHAAHGVAVQLSLAALALGGGIALLVWWWFPRQGVDAAGALRRVPPLSWLWTACAELWWIDRVYDAVIVRFLGRSLGRLFAALDLGTANRLRRLDGADPSLPPSCPPAPSLDGLIDGLARTVALVGRCGNALQSGRIGAYVGLALLGGGALLVVYLLG